MLGPQRDLRDGSLTSRMDDEGLSMISLLSNVSYTLIANKLFYVDYKVNISIFYFFLYPVGAVFNFVVISY